MSSNITGSVYDFKSYHYDPSEAAAIIFVILFTSSAVVRFFQLFDTAPGTSFLLRSVVYVSPLILSTSDLRCLNIIGHNIPSVVLKEKPHTSTLYTVEAVGYVGRVLSATESPNWTTGPYVIQSLLILIAPAFFAASIYMALGRIILLVDGEAHSLIPARCLTKIFVLGDVISFLAQSSVGGMLSQAKTKSDVSRGENIITGGLGVQILFFSLFIIVAGIFHYRISYVPTARSISITVPWERYLHILYAASFLILIRSVFRIVEYVMGQDGVLLDHEVYLYIFDATLMFLVTIVFNIFHPSQIVTRKRLQRDSEEYNLA